MNPPLRVRTLVAIGQAAYRVGYLHGTRGGVSPVPPAIRNRRFDRLYQEGRRSGAADER